jgi:hypothetical protein
LFSAATAKQGSPNDTAMDVTINKLICVYACAVIIMRVQWNDYISSVRVPAGLSVLLREHPNYGGRGLNITGPADIACLSQWSFSDITSSMQVGEQARRSSTIT